MPYKQPEKAKRITDFCDRNDVLVLRFILMNLTYHIKDLECKSNDTD